MPNQGNLGEPVAMWIWVLGPLEPPSSGDQILCAEAVTRNLIDNLKGARVRLEGITSEIVERILAPVSFILDGTLAGTRDFRGQTLHGFMDHFQVVVITDDGDTRTAVPSRHVASGARTVTRTREHGRG